MHWRGNKQATKKIGDYEVIGKIGEGGMATVYKGRQVSLDRPVAIKVLSKKLTDHSDVLERFNRESLIIARLNHPNIIHVIDRGVAPGGRPYFVMEYVEGAHLGQAIKAGNLETNRKLDLIIQVCKALSYAHKNGVIHRDIKPSNVLIDSNMNVLVLDFGIAKFLEGERRNGHHTQANVVMGTLDYMSPEQQISSNHVTAASDLYSLGVIMYELFTGVKPLGRFKPPSEINPTVPQPLEAVILRCLEPDPGDRFAAADEIKDLLLKILQGAHLPAAQREQAKQGLSKFEDKFAFLDIIKENRHGGVYLFQDRVDHSLMVIKKRINTSAGLKEAKLLTTLKHKNIVNILGTSRKEHLFIIVMEYLSGGSLKDRLIRPIPWRAVLRTAREISEGLSFAHKNRIVHGNLRPSNILFTESGQVQVADFGLDQHYSSGKGRGNWHNVFGEPKSPEADIFAFGTIVYQMLTGSPLVWKSDQILIKDHLKQLPIKLQKMVMRLLSRKQGVRYRSFDQVIEEFNALLTAHKGKTKRLEDRQAGKRLARTLLLLAILLIMALAYLNQSGDIKKYTDAILALWDKLTTYLGPFLWK